MKPVKEYSLIYLIDNPKAEDIQSNYLYIVHFDNFLKWLYMHCPCGCNDIILLSLVPSKDPYWEIYTDKKGKLSLYPSIRKLDGCKSHFFIESNKVLWAKNFHKKNKY